jgi:hypothetical protein
MKYVVSDKVPLGGGYQRQVGVSRFAHELATTHRRHGVLSAVGDAVVQRHLAAITGINWPINQAVLLDAPAKVFVAVHRGGGRFSHYICEVSEPQKPY